MKKIIFIIAIFTLNSCSSLKNSVNFKKYVKNNKIDYTIGVDAFYNENGDVVDKNKQPISGNVISKDNVIFFNVIEVKNGEVINDNKDYFFTNNVDKYLINNSYQYDKVYLFEKDAFVENRLIFVDKNKKPITGVVVLGYKNRKQFSRVVINKIKDGKINGLSMEFVGDKPILESNFIDGVLNGKCKAYFPNGYVKFDVNYKDGKVDGIFKKYYGEGGYGKLEKVITFSDGLKNGTEIKYFLSGNKEYEIVYKNGLKNGIYLTYSENGKVFAFFNFMDDKRNAEAGIFYLDGSVFSKTNYRDDKLDGKEIYYYKNGTKAIEITNENGKIKYPIVGYGKNGNKKFEIFDIKKNVGYCVERNGKKSRLFTDEEKKYSLNEFMEDRMCE